VCGIVGIYRRDGAAVDPDQLVRLRDSMIHRGPDDAGDWIRPRGDLGLAHRRLAIVDTSDAGHQPMANEDGSVQVVFGGEIYNHVELRRRLERQGHAFRSRCDTEVLVHLYEERGLEMVDELVGMFSFAIWDERRERLVLARDRLGVKPLYWLDDGRTFAFATEIKALLPLLGGREIDPTALRHYLTFVAVPPPRTLFRDVAKLAPASVMVVDRDGPREPRRYWDPLDDAARGLEPDDWGAELLTRLERSVERRMMSDVPVGVLLSGGVDSSTNVALMTSVTGEPVNTFSVGFRDAPDLNEFGWARQIAERYGANHREVMIDSDDLWAAMEALVHHQDEPIADPVCVPLYFVSELARRSGVPVVHVGEGADELLAGYPTYARARSMARGPWRLLRSLPGPLRAALARAGAAVLSRRPGREIEHEALLRAAERDGKLWWGGAVAFYEHAADRIATKRLRGDPGAPQARDVVAAIAADADERGARDDLDRIIYQDLRLRLPELLLMRVDKLTMAHSVEAREPFLDHELVELAMAMPSDVKVRGGVGKHVLKQVVSDLLPDEVVWRPKQGFSTPVAEWFRGGSGEELSRRLEGSAIHELGYLDRGRMRALVADHQERRADRSFQLWNLLNLCEWYDHWIATGDRDTVAPAGGSRAASPWRAGA
jgi:asparagine synthase (glutamine-hydrolysing)